MSEGINNYYEPTIKTSRNDDVYSIKFTMLNKQIEQLKQENKKLKEQVKIKDDGFMTSVDETCEYATILNELESWLEEKSMNVRKKLSFEKMINKGETTNLLWMQELSSYEDVLDKLKELKGSDE